MRYVIAPEPDYLQVDVFDREAGPQWEDFLRHVAAASIKSGCPHILVHCHGSSGKPVLGYFTLLKLAEALDTDNSHGIALVVDSDAEAAKLRQFGEMLKRGEPLNVMPFTDVEAALDWLLGKSDPGLVPRHDLGDNRRPEFTAAAASGMRR